MALLDAPPKALLFLEESLVGTCRFPILFPVPPPRFAPVLPALAPGRFVAAAPVLLGRAPALEPVRLAADAPRLPEFAPALEVGRLVPVPALLLVLACCRAFVCRVARESPRAVPP